MKFKYNIITLRPVSNPGTVVLTAEYEYESNKSLPLFVKQIQKDGGIMFADAFIPITAIAEIERVK